MKNLRIFATRKNPFNKKDFVDLTEPEEEEEDGGDTQIVNEEHCELDNFKKQPSITIAPKKEAPKTKTTDIIRDRMMRGAKRLTLLADFPSQHKVIKDLMELHPIEHEYTDCVYIFGGTGAGKTTTVKRVLEYFENNWGITSYAKMGGLSKFYDGYNWQDIILIDDPIAPDAKQNADQIQAFKTLINEHKRIIEIKGGSMPMDSGLIIITANITPYQMSMACGVDCQEAVFRRLTKSPGAFFMKRSDRDKMTRLLIDIIRQRFDLPQVIVDDAAKSLEAVKARQYDLHEWFGTREGSPIPNPFQAKLNFKPIPIEELESDEEE